MIFVWMLRVVVVVLSEVRRRVVHSVTGLRIAWFTVLVS